MTDLIQSLGIIALAIAQIITTRRINQLIKRDRP